jgi:tripartite-type tricarboxylate transporter receptor subunit TctC
MLAAITLAAGGSWGQAYPNQRVTVIVPYAPGGPTDVIARTVGAELEKTWKQPVIIENRPGAGGLVGPEYVTRQKPDGYTVLLHGSGVHTAKIFFKSMAFDPNDLRPVVGLGGSSTLLVVPTSLGVKTLKEFVDLAKSKPKQLNFGAIPFNSQELDYHVLQRLAGIQMTMVPYTSAVPQFEALMRGDIHFYMGVSQQVASALSAGKIVALGYSGSERHPNHPTVPTVRELGYDFLSGFTLGWLVHAKTPEDVVQRLGRDSAAALKVPEIATRLAGAGFLVPKEPLEWPRQVDREVKTYVEVARALNYQPQ